MSAWEPDHIHCVIKHILELALVFSPTRMFFCHGTSVLLSFSLIVFCCGVRQCCFSRDTLTSVGVVEIDELLPLVMVQQAENGSPQTGSHLDDKLHIGVNGEAGGDEGSVQGTAEGGQRVHGLAVVEPEDGINSPGELGADW
ncbi:hypothetical protein XENOCAPTIV_004906 [Xenoophorus captivus]|uniref:Uncharacterized protein n=1 Tax=Xenoophorus captivus TaxID=1517983 RepID=A0ABV0RNT9_9TELE